MSTLEMSEILTGSGTCFPLQAGMQGRLPGAASPCFHPTEFDPAPYQLAGLSPPQCTSPPSQ